MKHTFKVFVLCCSVSLFLGCAIEHKESPTKGKLEIYSTEVLAPLVDGEINRFQNLYSESFITNNSTSDREAIVHLLNDSAKCIIVSRSLNVEELEVAKKYNIEFTEHLFAYDAIAFVVNKNNFIEKLSTTQLESIFSGTVTDWNEIDSALSSKKIRIVLLNKNFGLYQILSQQLLHGKEFFHSDLLAQSTSEVIDFVGKSDDAIGFISVSWRNADTSNIKILHVQNSTPLDSSKEIATNYYLPLQYYIWKNYYPFVHSVYIYTREIGHGVGSGLVTFLLSAHPGEGQKIVGDYGLVPARMPIRIVQTQKKPLQ